MTDSSTPGKPKGLGSRPKLHKDGYWHAWVDFGTDPDTNQRDRRHIKRRTRDEVVERQIELLYERDGFTPQISNLPQARSVSDWFWYWLETKVKGQKAAATYEYYEGFIRRTIAPEIGGIRLRALSKDHVEEMLSNVATESMRKGVFKTVRAGLQAAKRVNLVDHNVAVDVEVTHPKPTYQTIDDFDFAPDPESDCGLGVKYLTDAETQLIFTCALAHPNYPRWILALVFGLRQSEALGLAWTDLNWNTGKLHVRRTFNRQRYQHGCPNPAACANTPGKCPNRIDIGRIGPPKSDAGDRWIPLGAPIVSVLKEHHRMQMADRLRSNQAWPRAPFMFTDSEGQPIQHRADYDNWKALLEEAGLPTHYALHDARHTAATAMGEAGVDDAAMQVIFGWSSRQMIEVYRHAVDERIQRAAEGRGERFVL